MNEANGQTALDFRNERAYGSPMSGETRMGRAFIMTVLLAGLLPAGPLPASPGTSALTASRPAADDSLEALLAKAAEYCRKLESSAFDFVCREEILEIVNPRLDAAAQPKPSVDPGSSGQFGAPEFLGPTLVLSTVKKMKRSLVYDYQCVRAGRTIREMRTQLEENGKPKVVPNAELETSVVVFATALLGPVGLFGERFQPDYIFTVAGRDRLEGVDVLIVDAKPRPGAPPSRSLYGQAWIDPASGNILKIEWSESRVGRFDVFVRRGELFKRTPRLTIRSEFSVEKNGIRFPSRLFVEETYLKGSGKAFVRSRTEVVYRDFKFFTVTFDVRS